MAATASKPGGERTLYAEGQRECRDRGHPGGDRQPGAQHDGCRRARPGDQSPERVEHVRRPGSEPRPHGDERDTDPDAAGSDERKRRPGRKDAGRRRGGDERPEPQRASETRDCGRSTRRPDRSLTVHEPREERDPDHASDPCRQDGVRERPDPVPRHRVDGAAARAARP